MYSEAKRREAAFFLERLRNAHHADDEYSYYLSAFVSAFRSVTFAIQFEYASKSSFANKVYQELQVELKSDCFARGMRDARNDQQKQGHTWPRLIIGMVNEENGMEVHFHSAPLPQGFDRFRGVETVTPLDKCLRLTGDQEEDAALVMQQALQAVLSLREGAWTRELFVKVQQSDDSLPVAEFFERSSKWLERFEEYIALLERARPVEAMHHVMSSEEAKFAASFGPPGSPRASPAH